MSTLPNCYRCGCQPCECKDGITLYHADCREVLPLLPKVDLVLTDPPYGIGVDVRMAKEGNSQHGKALAPKRAYDATGWDNKPIDPMTLAAVILAGRWVILWGGNYYPVSPSACWLVWDKMNGTNDFADCELAWTNLPGAVRIKRHQWNGMLRQGKEPRQHPTQKPRDVMRWCIELSKTTGTILDPYLGSGTTLRAAKDLGRKAIGIEIEEKYCEIAANRLRQEVLAFTEGVTV